MAVSAAEYYEVRWRVKGNDESWSSPRRVAPSSEVVIEELDRGTAYEFEVRAVSNCGAKSIWVPSDYTVPSATAPTSVDTLTAQSLADGVHLGWTSIATPAAGIESSIERSANGTSGWAERARVRSTAYTDPETSGTTYYYRVRYVNYAGTFGAYSPVASSAGVSVGSISTNASNAMADAAAAQADANAANAALADIASDNLLTPGEKPTVIRDRDVIIAEQAGIDAQATAYGITTEKTAYDSAVTALTTYLATLTSPTLWSNLSGNTTIVGATFRSKFSTVYTTRQTLLNKIYAVAKSLADAAQGTGNTALANAAAAQSAANAAQADATSSIAQLTDIASDGKLTADEKVRAKQDYLTVTTEQAGIDAQATAYGITTEKTAYDSAINTLKTYLKNIVGVLDASYNWTNITGTTAISRTTWDTNWTAVYTTRQTLLNKIYAVAKSLADAAQSVANDAHDTANGINSGLPVINPNYANGTTGWYFDSAGAGEWTVTTGTNGPMTGTTTYLAHAGVAGQTVTVASNIGTISVKTGQVVTLTVALKSVGANAGSRAYARIVWRNTSGSAIGNSTNGVTICTPDAGATYFSQGVSRVYGVAPDGAAYASAGIEFDNHVSGTYTTNGAVLSSQVGNADEVPESASKKWAAESGATVGADWYNNVANRPANAANVIEKSNFEDGLLGPWQRSGASIAAASASPYTTAMALTGTNNICQRRIDCDVGDTYYISCMLANFAGTGSAFRMLFYNASGGAVTYLGFDGSNGVGGWQTLSTVITVPAGAVAMAPTAYCASGTIYYTNFFCAKTIDSISDGPTFAKIRGTELANGNHKIGIAGSNYRIGDQRNLTAVTFGNYGSGWSGLTLSYTATTTSATISATSGTLQAGGTAIAYSASSVTLSGTAGSVVTYYLYYSDAGLTGGAKTLNATTNQITSLSNDGNVLLGTCKVTYPTSGTGGGGGGPTCPSVHAWVVRRDGPCRAGNVAVGDDLRVIDPATGAERWGRVTHSQPALAECVRVVTASGTALTCSATAPLGAAGGQVLAPDAAGHALAERRHGVFGHSACVSADPAGNQMVQHITCENTFFIVGDDPDFLLAHHNLKMLPP